MLRMAREKGCLTTMTTNGTALNRKNTDSLISAGLGRLVVSVDGMTPETYDPIRIGASFTRLTQKLTTFGQQVVRDSADLEWGIAFTLQRSNADDLDLIPSWMQAVGAKVLHLKHLNVVSNRQDWDSSYLSSLFNPAKGSVEALRGLEQKIASVIEGCRKIGIRVYMHSELPMSSNLNGRHCLATPLESIYFSFEGKVAPCCHFGHRVSRFFEGDLYPPSSLFYGDIQTQTLEEVWNSAAFVSFRGGFQTGDFPQACRTCYLLYGK